MQIWHHGCFREIKTFFLNFHWHPSTVKFSCTTFPHTLWTQTHLQSIISQLDRKVNLAGQSWYCIQSWLVFLALFAGFKVCQYQFCVRMVLNYWLGQMQKILLYGIQYLSGEVWHNSTNPHHSLFQVDPHLICEISDGHLVDYFTPACQCQSKIESSW